MSSPTGAVPTVGELMHHGVIAVAPQAPLAEVAAQMADSGVHCVVVEGLTRARDGQETLVWGVLSDLDLMRAAATGRLDANAGELAGTEIVTVESSDQVEDVTRLMADHECTHLVVVSPQSGEPVGVVSSLDVARALARPESPAP
jgi:CBS domain-containing protein